jgi:hypothetical protein
MYEIKGKKNRPAGVDAGCHYIIQKAENYC